MLKRYSLLREHIDGIVSVDLLLSPRSNSEVDLLLKSLSTLDLLTKFLQSPDRHMNEVRLVFDKAISSYDCLEEHCSTTASIVCDPLFESAVCKILNHQVLNEPLQLTMFEARCVEHLKIQQGSGIFHQQDSISDADDMDELTVLMKTVKRQKVQSPSRYIDCRFIRPTSNMCERLFSISKAAMPDSRKALHPANLEMQLFLKMNGHLWDIELFDFEEE